MNKNKFPSFKALHGREPIAGIDYPPDGHLCEDDHDYLSGSGQYSDNINQCLVCGEVYEGEKTCPCPIEDDECQEG